MQVGPLRERRCGSTVSMARRLTDDDYIPNACPIEIAEVNVVLARRNVGRIPRHSLFLAGHPDGSLSRFQDRGPVIALGGAGRLCGR